MCLSAPLPALEALPMSLVSLPQQLTEMTRQHLESVVSLQSGHSDLHPFFPRPPALGGCCRNCCSAPPLFSAYADEWKEVFPGIPQGTLP